MKIALLTHYLPTPAEDYTQLAALTVPNRDEWCARHGYQHIVHKGPYGNPALYYAVQRLYLLHDLMKQRPDIEMWWVLNVQAVITNLTKRLDYAVPDIHESLEKDSKDFWVAHDCHGLNAGSFIVRNSEWGREWVRFIADQSAARGDSHVWHEQKVMQELTPHVFFRDRIEIVPQRAFNSYEYRRYPPWNSDTPGDWRKGDLVLSLPGLTLQERLDIVRQVLQSDMIVR